jgi:FkbM family methyltransferase
VRRRDFVAGVAAGASPVLAGAIAVDLKRHPIGSRTSCSQQGEDIVLYHVARDLLGVEHPTYLDIGAADPIKGNNTYLMYETLGGHGVLVEPNPTFARALRRVRPRDTVVEAGIGVAETSAADYYVIKGDPLHNTFSTEQVASLQRGKSESVVERVVKMPLLDINQVIAKHLGTAPDVLSTDVEGLDYAILRRLDLKHFRPGCICAETAAMWSPQQNSDITRYLLSVGYVVRGGSTVNTIYVDDRRLPHGQG